MNKELELCDVSKEDQETGIPLPVSIDGALMETLTPSPYLESLGISREQRIANLLRLTRTMLNPVDESGLSGETQIPIPFMVLRGPLVREEILTIIVNVNKDSDGKKSISITQVMEPDL